MKNLIAATFATLLLIACSDNPSKTQTYQLYKTLDSLIDQHDDIIAAKEAEIRTISKGIHVVKLTPEQEFDLNQRLYEEYLAFRFDSAYYYINRNIQSSLAANDPERYAVSAIRMAHILSVTGIFKHARMLLDNIQVNQLSPTTRIEYYNQWAELNLYLSEMAQHTPYFVQYMDSAQYYRQLILETASKNSFEYLINLANYTCEQGDVTGAIKQFEEYFPKLQSSDRRYSILSSTLAYFHRKAGNTQQQERYLLLSAISDLRGAILENSSLRELSAMLMERGEYARAYRYLSLASNDAQLYGSRLRSVQVARLTPFITKAYDAEREQAQRRTNRLLIVISMIAVMLAATIVYTLSLIRKHHRDNAKIHQMNEMLSCRNKEIQTVNDGVQTLNRQMKEANRIKDEYIGRFLELCSAFILRSEERTKQLNRLARDKKLTELYADLRSPNPINESIRMFHRNFDTAFLNIYPNFIGEVNRLMSDGNQFDVSENSIRLTTELRILALIRLGINDNQKIADILRSSITTIYTYRSKLKAKAISKDSFDDDIRRIATY